jgi:hypothetical protein
MRAEQKLAFFAVAAAIETAAPPHSISFNDQKWVQMPNRKSDAKEAETEL